MSAVSRPSGALSEHQEMSSSVDWSNSHRELPDECYVRALYPFSSEEPSSLSFGSGDLIRVLTKLESGWWDGLLGGRRGWFPSNYVEEVEVVDSDEDIESIQGPDRAVPVEEVPDEPEVLSEQPRPPEISSERDISTDSAAFWIPHATSEGRIFYFNSLTGASKWDIPYSPLSAVNKSKAIAGRVAPITTGMRPPAHNEVEPDQISSPEQISSLHEALYLRNSIRTSNGTTSNNGWREIDPNDVESDILAEGSDHEGDDDQNEEDADGEVLLFSMPGDTAQDARDNPIYPGTAQDTASVGVCPPQEDPAAHEGWESNMGVVERLTAIDPGVTIYKHWATQLNKSLESLAASVASQSKSEYEAACEDMLTLVNKIVSSLSLVKEYPTVPFDSSTDLATDPEAAGATWKVQYRQMVAATSQLLLSAHVASNHWAVSSCTQKLLEDAATLVAIGVRLVQDAQSASLKPSSTVPVAVADRLIGGAWQGNGLWKAANKGSAEASAQTSLTTLSAASVLNLERFAASVKESLRSCKARLLHLEKAPSEAVAEAVLREIQVLIDDLIQTVQYCEQLDLSVLSPSFHASAERSPTVTDFSKSKQSLYDAAGNLVLSAQTITNPDSLRLASGRHSSAMSELKKAFFHLESAVQSTILHAQFMVQEAVNRYSVVSESTEDIGYLKSDEKMKRFFGDDAPPSALSGSFSSAARLPPSSSKLLGQSSPQEQTPWFLDHELESDLSYDSKGNVKAGTLLALVERLTRHDLLDSVYNNTFLLTYRSFTSAEELSSLLMQRFLIEPPSGLTPEQLEVWVERKQSPIRLRVFNVFKSWIENFFMEPPNDATRDWLTRMQEFAQAVMAEHIGGTPVLIKLIEKRIVQGDVPIKKLVLNTTTLAPPPILPRNMRKLRLLDLDPLEIARQLTIMESKLYNRIKPTECLDKSWSKPDAAEGAENIKAMILRSNQITAWVAEAILYQADLKKRVGLIKHFVHIAEKCRALHNFSTLTAIISGLNSAPIHRLRRTWDLLNARVAMSAEDLNKLMNSSKNFSQYREALHKMQPPCVPFLGVYLTDLTFIEDGNPNMSVKARHLINISKRQKTADVIRNIQQYQAVPYSLTVVPEIQEYIRNCMGITRDISELYDISLEREPREREDEKIARLLQESGFL